MKTKESAKSKKQSIIVKDLKAKKNPKGGAIYMKFGSVNTGVQPTTGTQGFFLK